MTRLLVGLLSLALLPLVIVWLIGDTVIDEWRDR